MDNSTLFIMGLPGAGKTTFLAALWHVLNNSQNVSIKSNKLIGDQSYLADISKKWVDANALDRTKRSAEQRNLELLLSDSKGRQITLNFPDLSGESFQNQWESREIYTEHADIAKKAMGAFLFIHPEKIVEEHLISSLPPSIMAGESANSGTDNGTSSWTHKDAPLQVQIVELLQFLAHIRNEVPLNLGIIISAWDLVVKNKGTKKNPEKWLCNRSPLLWQFLKANHEIFNVVYYGISAQGGGLSDADKLRRIADPCKKILVVDQLGTESNDITLPISWILDNNA